MLFRHLRYRLLMKGPYYGLSTERLLEEVLLILDSVKDVPRCYVQVF